MKPEITVEKLSEEMNKLLTEVKKGDAVYRSAYVDGVLDMFNSIKAIIEPTHIKVE